MAAGNNTKLRWVLINGVLRAVSDFSSLRYGERPKSFCPVCKEQVILKLGQERAPHCAHKSGVDCITRSPETALHYNAKYYIYHQLLKGNLILINEVYKRCGCSKSKVWIQDWDEVRLECYVGNRKPDIILYKKGEIIGAIEVCVFHKVDSFKSADFENIDIQWVEVEVTNEESEIFQWDTSRPFPLSSGNLHSTRICPECEEYEKNNYSKLKSVKVVDFYYPSGRKYRKIYCIREVCRNGNEIELILEGQDYNDHYHEYEGTTYSKTQPPFNKEKSKHVQNVFHKVIEAHCKKTKAIWDSPMGWFKMPEELVSLCDFLCLYERHLEPRYAWWNAEKNGFYLKVIRI